MLAVKYAPNFVVLTRDSNANKLYDLVMRLKIQEHLIKDFSELNTVYAKKISRDDTKKIIKTEIKNAKSYLSRYL